MNTLSFAMGIASGLLEVIGLFPVGRKIAKHAPRRWRHADGYDLVVDRWA